MEGMREQVLQPTSATFALTFSAENLSGSGRGTKRKVSDSEDRLHCSYDQTWKLASGQRELRFATADRDRPLVERRIARAEKTLVTGSDSDDRTLLLSLQLSDAGRAEKTVHERTGTRTRTVRSCVRVADCWTFTTCGFETDLPCMLAYDYACARASPRSFTCPVEIMAIFGDRGGA